MDRNQSSIVLYCYLILICLFCACKKDEPSEPGTVILSNLQVINNPSGYAPLTAKLQFDTDQEVKVQLRVIGKNGAASDVVHPFPDKADAFDLTVLGLYPDYDNQIELSFLNDNGQVLDKEIVNIQTEALHVDLPKSEVNERIFAGISIIRVIRSFRIFSMTMV